MTRKDYELIAKAISEAHEDNFGDSSANEGIYWVTGLLADKLAEDNPRFDRFKFVQACEPVNNPHEVR